jgi:hypothetical protein
VIKGINGAPYIDMSQYIDLDHFKNLQPEIIKGFAEARMYAKEGTWMEPGFTFKEAPASPAACVAKVAKPCHVVWPLGTAW